MKRFAVVLLTLCLLVSSMAVFALTSYADADTTVPKEEIESTLALPDGSDYIFYAQTRTNRVDQNKKDVRILCVVDEAWLDSVYHFVTTLTFTDGTNTKTLKSVGIKNVFKSITAYGANGETEIYTAAEGTVIFGWVITDVPAEYADVTNNPPKASVATEAGSTADSIMGEDYDTPVTVKDDINVETDGIYHLVETDMNGKVGGFDHDGSKATFILSGNYEGIYEMKVWYSSMDHRWFNVTVNGGVTQSFRVVETTDFWDFNDQYTRDDAKYYTIQVELKKGANVITFAKGDGYGINLVDFDLERIAALPTGTPVEVLAPENADAENWTFEGGVAFETLDNGAGRKLGWLLEENIATYTYTAPKAGKYLVAVYYLNNDDTWDYPRMMDITVNGESTVMQVVKTNSWGDPNYAVAAYVVADFVEGENTVAVSGDPVPFKPERTDAPPITKIVMTPFED